jgi:hypothetical protein
VEHMDGRLEIVFWDVLAAQAEAEAAQVPEQVPHAAGCSTRQVVHI